MNPKEKDDEIIELTDEELDEIFADDDFDNGEDLSLIHISKRNGPNINTLYQCLVQLWYG